MRARTHVWTHMRSHTCMGTHVFAHARMHMYGRTCVRTHAHMHMYGRTRAHTHSHAHTPAHAPHAHSPMPLSPPCRLTQEQEGRQRPHGGPVAAAGSGDAAWEGGGEEVAGAEHWVGRLLLLPPIPNSRRWRASESARQAGCVSPSGVPSTPPPHLPPRKQPPISDQPQLPSRRPTEQSLCSLPPKENHVKPQALQVTLPLTAGLPSHTLPTLSWPREPE